MAVQAMSWQIFIIIMTAIVGGLTFLCLPIVMVFWSRVKRQDSRRLSDQEEKSLRETWDDLQRMEQRIENLETILLERERKISEKL